MRVIAIDGHDGTGKTTLSKGLAARVEALYIRPFGGAHGEDMVRAWRAGRSAEVLRIGEYVLRATLHGAQDHSRVVLDRGWLTVATLVPRPLFEGTWRLWLPTALILCDEKIRRARLRERGRDDAGADAWPPEFLDAYRDRFELHPGPVIRTDTSGEEACLAALERAFDRVSDYDLPPPPR